jgi:hypothetical protein
MESKAYQEALGEFHARHLCTIKPMPDGVLEGLGWMQKDPTVCFTM